MRRITYSSTIALLAVALGAGIPAAAHQGPHVEARKKISTTRYAWGVQGDPRKATRTINIDMADTMRFTPDTIEVEPGTTVKFVVKNGGAQMHEMVIGTEAALREHAEMMKRHHDMAHDEPFMVHVKPGGEERITWTFTRAGAFMYGCLVPGHWEAGMKGVIDVAAK